MAGELFGFEPHVFWCDLHASTYPLEPLAPSLEGYLLGRVDYDVALALQNRLVYEASGRADGQIAVILCEHPATLAIGRRGSRAHVQLSARDLASHGVVERWVNHGGGCLLHLPGQLAVYPIVPLAWHKWPLGEYLSRLEIALRGVLEELNFKLEPPRNPPSQQPPIATAAAETPEPDAELLPVAGHWRPGVWGRTGQLAALAVAAKHEIAYHGAFINVCPDVDLFRFIHSDPEGQTTLSSLVAERQQPVRMTTVREATVRHLCQALACSRFHLHTGHPLLHQIAHSVRDSARVG